MNLVFKYEIIMDNSRKKFSCMQFDVNYDGGNFYTIFCELGQSNHQGSFSEEYFKNCYVNSPNFDLCIKEALNSVRQFFKTGVPKYNIAPFDPFYAEEITTRRGLRNLGFVITLRNVSETGWSSSTVTEFMSDLKKYKVSKNFSGKSIIFFVFILFYFFAWTLHIKSIVCL